MTPEPTHDLYEAIRRAFDEGQKSAREQVLAEEGLIPRYAHDALKLEVEAVYKVLGRAKEANAALRDALRHAVGRSHLHSPLACEACEDAERALATVEAP